MANQTDERANIQLTAQGVWTLPVLGAESITYYRGEAIAVDNSTGIASKELDGDTDVQFCGVLQRTTVVPASSHAEYAARRQLICKRDGAVSFTANATPDATWLFQKVWFSDNQTVRLDPADARYPVFAGRVVGIPGMVGCGQLGSTEVLVAIGDAVNQGNTQETGELRVNVGTLAASGSTQANAIANAAISKSFTQVTGADNAKGVALPTPVAGQIYIVKVASAAGSYVCVYPQSGGAINAVTANSPYNTAAVGSVAFIAWNATQWYTLPLAG